MTTNLDFQNLTTRDAEALPPEILEALRPYRRLLAKQLLANGDIAAWAEGLKIRTPKGIEVLSPYQYQKALWQAGPKSRFRIVLKARQIGVTEGMAIEMMAKCYQSPETNILLVSARQQIADEVLQKVYRMNEQEGDAGLVLRTKTKNYCVFENGARIHSLPASEEAAVGHSATDVYLDEFAHMPFASEIYEQIMPTISIAGRICIVSTPRGQSGKFYELWRGTINRTNDYWPLRVHWSQCPAYNPKHWNVKDEKRRIELAIQGEWYKALRPQYSDSSWASQFECDFVASLDMYFSEAVIEWIRTCQRKPKSEEKAGNGMLKIWEEPRRKAQYVIAADPATGIAHGDWSVAVVLDAARGEVVATLRGHWTPYVFANYLYDLRRRGYEGIIVIERPGPGLAVLEKLAELDPSCLYRDKNDKRLGWITSPKSRPQMLAGLDEALRKRMLKMRDEEFENEANVFVRDERGIPSAPRGEHDDLVLATAICWAVREYAPAGIDFATSWAPRFGETTRTGY